MPRLAAALCLLLAAAAHAGPTFHALNQQAGGGAPQTYTLVDARDTGDSSQYNFAATVHALATTVHAAESYQPTRVSVRLAAVGSPTGAITAYLYDSATPGLDAAPDDRVATAAATVAASSVTTGGTGEWIDFDFSGAPTWSLGDHFHIVLYYPGGTASNTLAWRLNTFTSGDNTAWARVSASQPAATNDAAAWTEHDNNGSFMFRTYKSP